MADIVELLQAVKLHGDSVRQLKGANADKAAIDAAVKQLLASKAAYEQSSGAKWTPTALDQALGRSPTEAPARADVKAKSKDKPKQAAKPKQEAKSTDGKKQTKCGPDGGADSDWTRPRRATSPSGTRR